MVTSDKQNIVANEFMTKSSKEPYCRIDTAWKNPPRTRFENIGAMAIKAATPRIKFDKKLTQSLADVEPTN